MTNLTQITAEQGGGPWDDIPSDAMLTLESPTRGTGKAPQSLLVSSDGLAAGNVAVAAAGVVTAADAPTGRVSRTQAQINADTVCVRDYGALGDGVTDDTLALKKAHATGASAVYYPGGHYITSDIVQVEDNQTAYGDDR